MAGNGGFALFTTFHDPHNYVHETGRRVMRRYTTSCFVHVIMHREAIVNFAVFSRGEIKNVLTSLVYCLLYFAFGVHQAR